MFATEQCLLVLTHHPAVWHQAAQFLDQSAKLLTEKGVRKLIFNSLILYDFHEDSLLLQIVQHILLNRIMCGDDNLYKNHFQNNCFENKNQHQNYLWWKFKCVEVFLFQFNFKEK